MFWRKKNRELEIISCVQKLQVSDNDIIVFRYIGILSDNSICHLREALEEILSRHGFNAKIILLEDGLNIQCVLTKSKIKELTED